MDSKEKLKSCPFCKTEKPTIYSYDERIEFGTISQYYIKCDNCESKTADYLTPEEAIEAWNKRADTKQDTIKEVIKLIDDDELSKIIIESRLHSLARENQSLRWGDDVGGIELSSLISKYLKQELNKIMEDK